MRGKSRAMKRCQIQVIKEATGIFPEYKPEVGAIYEATYIPRTRRQHGDGHAEFCVIDILYKKIVLRGDEFEVVAFYDEERGNGDA